MTFLWENDRFAEKIAKFCSESFHGNTDSRFVLKFHKNRPQGNGRNDVLYCRQKSAQNAFLATLCARSTKGAKSLQVCHVTPSVPVKFRPSRFRFTRIIPKNVILDEYIFDKNYFSEPILL